MSEENVFPKKWATKLPPGFRDTAESLETDEIKERLIEYQKLIAQNEKDMEDDHKLEDAKQQVKDLSAVYKESIVINKQQIKYLIFLLQCRGQ
jgi:hypothetical protein